MNRRDVLKAGLAALAAPMLPVVPAVIVTALWGPSPVEPMTPELIGVEGHLPYAKLVSCRILTWTGSGRLSFFRSDGSEIGDRFTLPSGHQAIRIADWTAVGTMLIPPGIGTVSGWRNR
jgi:hypothetical protein